MQRREFLGALGGAAAWPLAARAQEAERVRRIGVLMAAAADDPEFKTRIAAFLLSGEMAIGYWALHVPQSLYPILNGGEIMVLYSFAFLYFAAKGPGPWSLDAKRKAA